MPDTCGRGFSTLQGDCKHEGNGVALIKIKGLCINGLVALTRTEGPNPDLGLTGTLSCPSYSQPYLTFYPPPKPPERSNFLILLDLRRPKKWNWIFLVIFPTRRSGF